jgi:prepilin-type N-terminal cleavage/methylation domain-containing protein
MNQPLYLRSNPGFTLVELLIATAVASILGAFLFAAVYQINRGVPRIDTLTYVNEKAAILNAQLERDLSGVTVPNEFYARQKSSSGTQPTEQSKEPQSSKQKKPLEKFFYGTQKEGQFDQLSFITTNPLQVYWGAKSGSAKPRIARVQYRVEEEPKNSKDKNAKKSYHLIRQESDNLEPDAVGAGKEGATSHVIAGGIKSIRTEYSAVLISEQKEPEPKEPKESKDNKAEQKPKKKKEIKKTADWLGKKDESEMQKPAADITSAKEGKLPLVPEMVEFIIEFWDLQKKRSFPYSFKTLIRSEFEEKRESSPKILEKLKNLVGQAFPAKPAPNQQLAQSPSTSWKGMNRR